MGRHLRSPSLHLQSRPAWLSAEPKNLGMEVVGCLRESPGGSWGAGRRPLAQEVPSHACLCLAQLQSEAQVQSCWGVRGQRGDPRPTSAWQRLP